MAGSLLGYGWESKPHRLRDASAAAIEGRAGHAGTLREGVGIDEGVDLHKVTLPVAGNTHTHVLARALGGAVAGNHRAVGLAVDHKVDLVVGTVEAGVRIGVVDGDRDGQRRAEVDLAQGYAGEAGIGGGDGQLLVIHFDMSEGAADGTGKCLLDELAGRSGLLGRCEAAHGQVAHLVEAAGQSAGHGEFLALEFLSVGVGVGHILDVGADDINAFPAESYGRTELFDPAPVGAHVGFCHDLFCFWLINN